MANKFRLGQKVIIADIDFVDDLFRGAHAKIVEIVNNGQYRIEILPPHRMSGQWRATDKVLRPFGCPHNKR
jgi:hypothetical protein